MKKLLCMLALSAVLLSGCSVEMNNPESSTDSAETTIADASSETVQELLELLQDGDTLGDCDVEWEKNWVDGVNDFTKEQMTSCYEVFNVSITLLSAPNMNFAGVETREWEEDGHEAWAGLLIRKIAGEHEVFFKIPDEGYNPVALYQTEETLVLDTVAGDGAGSGEGTLQRYTYAFAGVTDELLYTWQKEKCTGYYVPETYDFEKACN